MESLRSSTENQSKQANKYQKDILYAVGDKIWLSTKNIATN